MSVRLGFSDRVVIVLVVAVLVGGFVLTQHRGEFDAADRSPVGRQDFVAHWSAFQVAGEGGDPYDVDELAAAQSTVSREEVVDPQRYWNPPWTLVLLAPLLRLDFGVSANTFLVLNLVLAVVVSWMAWRLFGRRGPPVLAIGFGALTVTLIDVAMFGQLSLLMTLLVVSLIAALDADRDDLAGVLLALLTVKPQAAFLVVVAVLWLVLGQRRWRVLRSGTLAAVVLVGATAVWFPRALEGWNPRSNHPTDFLPVSLAAPARELWFDMFGSTARWLGVVIAAAALAITIRWLRRSKHVDLVAALPMLAIGSVLAAPYVWFFDHSLLLIVPVALIARVADSPDDLRRPTLLSLVLIQGVVGWHWDQVVAWHQLFWYPLALLCLMVYVDRRLASTPSKKASESATPARVG